jgi:hypothetical protein
MGSWFSIRLLGSSVAGLRRSQGETTTLRRLRQAQSGSWFSIRQLGSSIARFRPSNVDLIT